jgi:hypothetical protein
MCGNLPEETTDICTLEFKEHKNAVYTKRRQLSQNESQAKQNIMLLLFFFYGLLFLLYATNQNSSQEYLFTVNTEMEIELFNGVSSIMVNWV